MFIYACFGKISYWIEYFVCIVTHLLYTCIIQQCLSQVFVNGGGGGGEGQETQGGFVQCNLIGMIIFHIKGG